MLWTVLKRNISPWQIAGYALATLVGLTIVLIALQFYADVSSTLGSPGTSPAGVELMGKRTKVISKPVSLRNTLSGKAPAFSAEEIAAISSQPWAADVSAFRASDYSVWAGIELGGRTLSTALFFESVPDRYIDIDTPDWTFDPEHPEIPVIIAKDYLTLYNFGFAASGRMPAVSEAMLSSIPMQVTLSGRGRTATLPARIVGFSSQLNTIAVPESFMEWAHERFGSDMPEPPSRLIIATADPSDPAIDKYLSAQAYDVAGPSNDLGRASRFLTVLTVVIVCIGGIITLLALGILVLSLYLLVQKNRRDIAVLVMLGFTPGSVARRYVCLAAAVNAGILVLASGLLLLLRGVWEEPLREIDFAPASPLVSLFCGVAIMAVVTVLNVAIIRRLIWKIAK